MDNLPVKRGPGRPKAVAERDVVFTALYANPNTPRKRLAKLVGKSKRWVTMVVHEWENQTPEQVETQLERMRNTARYGAQLQMQAYVKAALAALAEEPDPDRVHRLNQDVARMATIFGLDAPQRVVVAQTEQPWERILAAVQGDGTENAQDMEPGDESLTEVVVGEGGEGQDS